jgi:hypothetical protein
MFFNLLPLFSAFFRGFFENGGKSRSRVDSKMASGCGKSSFRSGGGIRPGGRILGAPRCSRELLLALFWPFQAFSAPSLSPRSLLMQRLPPCSSHSSLPSNDHFVGPNKMIPPLSPGPLLLLILPHTNCPSTHTHAHTGMHRRFQSTSSS